MCMCCVCGCVVCVGECMYVCDVRNWTFIDEQGILQHDCMLETCQDSKFRLKIALPLKKLMVSRPFLH